VGLSFAGLEALGEPAESLASFPPEFRHGMAARAEYLGDMGETGSVAPMPQPEVLGRNGTYVAFRKLHQQVAAFRQNLRQSTADRSEDEWLSAKLGARHTTIVQIPHQPMPHSDHAHAPRRSTPPTRAVTGSGSNTRNCRPHRACTAFGAGQHPRDGTRTADDHPGNGSAPAPDPHRRQHAVPSTHHLTLRLSTQQHHQRR
jgi:hypothetical protein